MLKVQSFEVNPFGEMTYLVYDPVSRECAVVDPGMENEREQAAIDRWIAANNLTVKYLVATHLHIDHVWGVPHIKETYGVSLTAHPDDAMLGAMIDAQAQMFGQRRSPGNMKPDVEVTDGDILHLGDNTLKVLHVPGHSPGGIVLYAPGAGFVIGGDALFRGSIGRTDLPGGNQTAFLTSLRRQLMSLPDDTVVYPGHGPATTVGQERRSNPWLGTR